MGTGKMVPRHELAPEWYPGTYWHQNGSWPHISTKMVPRHVWAPEWYPGAYGHEMVPGNIWELKRCLGSYQHRKGARAYKGNGKLPGHRNGAGEHMGIVMAPRYI